MAFGSQVNLAGISEQTLPGAQAPVTREGRPRRPPCSSRRPSWCRLVPTCACRNTSRSFTRDAQDEFGSIWSPAVVTMGSFVVTSSNELSVMPRRQQVTTVWKRRWNTPWVFQGPGRVFGKVGAGERGAGTSFPALPSVPGTRPVNQGHVRCPCPLSPAASSPAAGAALTEPAAPTEVAFDGRALT